MHVQRHCFRSFNLLFCAVLATSAAWLLKLLNAFISPRCIKIRNASKAIWLVSETNVFIGSVPSRGCHDAPAILPPHGWAHEFGC